MQLVGGPAAHRRTPVKARRGEGSSAEFERVLMRISATFAGVRWHCVWGEVDLALRDLMELSCLDEAFLLEVLDDSSDACLRHVTCAADLPKPAPRFSY